MWENRKLFHISGIPIRMISWQRKWKQWKCWDDVSQRDQRERGVRLVSFGGPFMHPYYFNLIVPSLFFFLLFVRWVMSRLLWDERIEISKVKREVLAVMLQAKKATPFTTLTHGGNVITQFQSLSFSTTDATVRKIYLHDGIRPFSWIYTLLNVINKECAHASRPSFPPLWRKSSWAMDCALSRCHDEF